MTSQDFWGEVWRSGRTGFHRPDVTPELLAHHNKVLGGADRVLVPLCGRTPDLAWLAPWHTEVVGVEFVPEAVLGYADASGLIEGEPVGPFRAFRKDSLTILLGDFFAATPATIGTFDGLWDRAALIALDLETRPRYAHTARNLLRPNGSILLVTWHRDEPQLEGPPFEVGDAEVRRLYPGGVRLISDQRSGDRTITTYALRCPDGAA